MPRWIEWIIAFLLLIALSPLLLLIMLAIVIDSPGWPLFFQRRVGLQGSYFWMIKFRKMHNSVPKEGKGITTQNDVRLTRVGRILERFKLDELPQILNVLFGDMALVGPRPEIPKFTLQYPEKWQEVLKIRPGIVGYSQVVTPHENDLYPPDCFDHEKYYIDKILPSKLDEEIQYTKKRSLRLDLKILLHVSYSLVTKTINRHWIAVRLSQAFMLLSDSILSVLSLLLSFIIVYQYGIPQNVYPVISHVVLVSLIIRPICFILFGLHKNPISSTITLGYLIQILKATFYSSLLLITALMLTDERDLVLSAHLVDLFVLPGLLIGIRVTYIFLHDAVLAAESLSSWSRALFHIVIILSHGFIGFFTFWLAHIIRLQQFDINLLIPKIGLFSLYAVAIRLALSIFLWPPRAKTWRAFYRRDLLRLFNISITGTGCILIVYLMLQEEAYSRLSIVLDFFLYMLFAGFLSLLWFIPQANQYQKNKPKKAIILGIGVETELLLSTLQRVDSDSWQIIGIVTDIDWKRYASVSGVRVIGTVADIPSLFELHHPDILVSWEWIQDTKYFNYINNLCNQNNISFTIFPSIGTVMSNQQILNNVPTTEV